MGDQKGGSIVDDDQLRHRTQKASQLRWDRKQKNFTQGNGDKAEQGKMIKTESGTLLPASYNSGKYRQWKAKSRHVVPDGQEQQGLQRVSQQPISLMSDSREPPGGRIRWFAIVANDS
jgi:hypothetical protein